MTPKEKAEELVDKYKEHIIETDDYFINSGAKECALIAVDQILNLCWGNNKVGIKYWQDVKKK